MPVFIANHTAEGGEVQMPAGEWRRVVASIGTSLPTLALARRIESALNAVSVADDVHVRIWLPPQDIDTVDRIAGD